MSFSFKKAALLSIAIIGAVSLAACTTSGSNGSSENKDYVTEGKITIATGQPSYSPWVLENKPESGEGFESAVAYAVAKELGFDKKDVVWVRSSFDSAIAPGPKDWDLNIQQFSITDERKKAVDFSSPYYVTTQAVITSESSPAAKAKTIDDLKNVVIGVASGTTSLDVVNDLIAPTASPQVFNSNEDAVQALQSGQIEAVVTDLPSAFYLRDAVLENGVIVGQLIGGGSGDELAFVLPKNSKITSKVTKAVDKLKDNGTLKSLEEKWLADTGNAPILE